MYKVVKIYWGSGRREVIEKGLKIEQARRVVRSYPNSMRTIVVFTKQ